MKMANINLTINGNPVSVPAGTTVLEAAGTVGIRIPTLCAYEGMGPHAACRLCIVQVEGEEKEKLACATKVSEGMRIVTDSPVLFERRRAALTDLFRQHPADCDHCARVGGSRIEDLEPEICENCFYCDCQRKGFCELQALAREFGISVLPFEPRRNDFTRDESTGVILRDPNKCVKCRRCVDVCRNTQAVGVLGMVKTENGQTVGVTTAASLAESACIRCGRCVDVCPTGAVWLREHKDELPYYAHMRGVTTAALVDSTVLPELSKLYGGEISLGQLSAALRKIGVDRVYDAQELQRTVALDAAQKLAVWDQAMPALVAVDPAAKAFLEQKYADRRDQFVFFETAQARFAAMTKGQFDRLYRISGRNSLADEVQKTDCADFFFNAREIFRICRRTGANPTRLPEAPLDSLGVAAEPSAYDAVLGSVDWQVGGQPEKLVLQVSGRAVPAMICHNPMQLAEAIKDETVRIIRVNA